MTNGQFSQTLSADDFTNIGDWLGEVETALTQYHDQNVGLSNDEKKQLEDVTQQVNYWAHEMYTKAVTLVIDDARASVEKIQQATQDAKAAVTVIANINKVIAIAGGVIKIGASVMSKDIGGIVDGIGQVYLAIGS